MMNNGNKKKHFRAKGWKRLMVKIALICDSVPCNHEPSGNRPTCHLQSRRRAVSVTISCLTLTATLTFIFFSVAS